MRLRVHIVASCTNRKRLPVPPDLRLRTVQSDNSHTRARLWFARLAKHRSAAFRAAELYGGDHWSVIQSLPVAAQAARLLPDLWVISAGYGLVSEKAPLRSYSATFGRGYPDSIARGDRAEIEAVNQAWWNHLIDWSGPQRAPRSLEMLVRQDPSAGMLIIGSADYIRAVEKDLLAASERLDDPRRLVIISSREMAEGRLQAHVIASDARLQNRLGGARTSLHARVGRKLLGFSATCGWEVGRLRDRYRRMLASTPEDNVTERKRLTDEDVRQFIVQELTKDPRGKATGLLRRLRESGQACEQARFKALFIEVQKKTR